MVMQIYGGLKKCAEAHACGEKDIEDLDLLAGNLCRCTGYRPIQDTLKSFGTDTSVATSYMCTETGPYDASADPAQPSALDHQDPSVESDLWKRPQSLDQLVQITSASASDIQLCSGHTGWGVYPEINALRDAGRASRLTVQIDQIPDLLAIQWSEGASGVELSVGSGVTIARLAETLNGVKSSQYPHCAAVATGLADHLLLIAGHQVRNRGSIGGNLMMVRNRNFASDLAPCLVALNARVDVLSATGAQQNNIDLLDFLSQDRDAFAVLVRVHIPLGRSAAPDAQNSEVFVTYRTSFRPRNAYALANAAFRLTITNGAVSAAKFVFGALGNVPRVSSAGASLLTGQPFSPETFKGLVTQFVDAVRVEVGQLVNQDSHDHHTHYRLRLVQSFAFKFISILTEPSSNAAVSIHSRRSRRTRTAQVVPANDSRELKGLAPAFEPHSKTTALAQTTGDARFLDDELPARSPSTVSAAIVSIPEANMTYQDIDASEAVAIFGSDFVGILTSKDLERTNKPLSIDWSVFSFLQLDPAPPPEFDSEFIFLPPATPSRYAGQPIALVVCRNQRLAERAAAFVKIIAPARAGPTNLSFDSTPVMPPYQFTRGAKKNVSSLTTVHPSHQQSEETAEGETQAALQQGPTRKVTGQFVKASQNHFYLEPQSCLAIPEEEGGLTVWVSCQGTDSAQRLIALQTRLAQSQVVVKFRRVGGSFGGKFMRTGYFSVLASLAALYFRVPVRLILPRHVDTTLVGGRQQIRATWEVNVLPDGKLRDVLINVDMGQGAYADMSPIQAMVLGASIDMCYDYPTAVVNVAVILTPPPPPCNPLKNSCL
eukprot:c15509_g1_i2.p1 GENE.c15509_g1_i2~~c15509_g1_i2.p1  ORF type:complete len:958 (-),score=210.72 c15509_g1_i2:1537-4020(-)